MIRLVRLGLITTPAIVVVITSSLFGQTAGQAQDPSPAPGTRNIVVSTPAPPPPPEPAPSTTVAVEQDSATRATIAAAEKTVQQSLSIGAPTALHRYVTRLAERKNLRLGITPLAERILAQGIAKRQLATRGVRSLSVSALDTAVDTISDQEVADIFDVQKLALTGFKVPDDKAALERHIKAQNQKARRVIGQSRQVLAVGAAVANAPNKSLPKFNWTQPGLFSTGIVTAVQNQNTNPSCAPGVCWAFATVGVFEAAYAKANGVLIGASEQYLLDCAKGALQQIQDPPLGGQPWSCQGGWWAFPLICSSDSSNPGLPLRTELPYTGNEDACPASIDKPYQANTWGYVGDGLSIPTKDQLKDALCTYGPLAVAIFGDTAWAFNKGDVIDGSPSNPANPSVNHAVVLVGWDDTKGDNGAWIIKNSWGTGYGINGSGFLYIAYDNYNVGYSAAYVIVGAAPN